jgi:hypothetical protein
MMPVVEVVLVHIELVQHQLEHIQFQHQFKSVLVVLAKELKLLELHHSLDHQSLLLLEEVVVLVVMLHQIQIKQVVQVVQVVVVLLVMVMELLVPQQEHHSQEQ